MPPDAVAVLAGVRDAIAFIDECARGKTRKDYLRDRALRAIVERQFITIGEALTRVRDRHPSIHAQITDARKMIEFRNLLVHAYDYVNDDRVWFIVERHQPVLRQEIAVLLKDFPPLPEPT